MEAVNVLILKLRKLLHSRGRTRDEADEAIQEAFLRLQRYRQDRHVQEPEAFLVRTVINVVADDGRRQSRWRPASLTEVEALPFSETGSSPDDVMLGQQRLRGLRAGLDQLNPRTREIFLLHRVEGYSHAQIAARMGITVSAVEKQVAKAILFLTEWMDRI